MFGQPHTVAQSTERASMDGLGVAEGSSISGEGGQILSRPQGGVHAMGTETHISAPSRKRTRAHACIRLPLSQPQGHVQILLNMLRGYSAQAALDAPRFCISAGSPETQSNASGEAGDVNSEVYFEEGIADDVVEKLRGKCVGSLSVDGNIDGVRCLSRYGPRCTAGHWIREGAVGSWTSHSARH